MFKPKPYSTKPGVPATTLVTNYNNGTKAPAGRCVARSALRLTRPPLLKCAQYDEKQFPTSYEKSILPCIGKDNRLSRDKYSTATPVITDLPQGNDTDAIVAPSPNGVLAQSIVSMGTKPAIPYVPRYFGRIMTQADVSAINFGSTMQVAPSGI